MKSELTLEETISRDLTTHPFVHIPQVVSRYFNPAEWTF